MTGEELLRLLERRLDNVVYRLGFAGTRAQARQFVNHGHVLVDGKKVDIASFLVTPGETIKIKDRVRESASAATELTGSVAGWLQTDFDALEGKVLRLPERMDINAPSTSSSSSSCTPASKPNAEAPARRFRAGACGLTC